MGLEQGATQKRCSLGSQAQLGCSPCQSLQHAHSCCLGGPVAMRRGEGQQGWWGPVADDVVGLAGTWACWSHHVCTCVCTRTVGAPQDPRCTVQITSESAIQDLNCGTSASMIPSGTQRSHRFMSKHIEILSLLGKDVRALALGGQGNSSSLCSRNHQCAEPWLGRQAWWTPLCCSQIWKVSYHLPEHGSYKAFHMKWRQCWQPEGTRSPGPDILGRVRSLT